jgi:hypothetical protein
MAIKIEKKIVNYKVESKQEVANLEVVPVVMNETIKRPDFLMGSTYKIKPPVADHAMYITINDILLNEDTDHEKRMPYEIFINSKSMEHYQWVIALTRVISAVFRKGGDITFLVDELCSVYDPNGGYYKKGGVYMPSLVAEISSVIKRHMETIGLLEVEGLSVEAKKLIADKKEKLSKKENEGNSGFPVNAKLCLKCHQKSVVVSEGCAVCLNCSDSKCS